MQKCQDVVAAVSTVNKNTMHVNKARAGLLARLARKVPVKIVRHRTVKSRAPPADKCCVPPLATYYCFYIARRRLIYYDDELFY